MKRTETYHFLRALIKDVEVQSSQSLSYQVFNAEKIRRLNEQNRFRVNIMNKKIDELADKYVEKDEAGNKLTIEEEGTTKWKFATDEDKQAYNKEYQEFMSQHIDIML
jgi:hypothetical protein